MREVSRSQLEHHVSTYAQVSVESAVREASPVRVLTITPFYPSLRNEVNGCFVQESLMQLEALGFQCPVFAVNSVYHRAETPIPRSPAQWIRYFPFPGKLGLASSGWFLGNASVARVEGLHRRSAIDLIHAHSALPCGHAAARISERLGIPFVVTVHGLDVFNACGQTGFTAARRRKASKRVYERASCIICISEKIHRILRNGMPTAVRSRVVYNGADPVIFSPARRIGDAGGVPKPRIVTVGNLSTQKGQELVIRAISHLIPSFPDLQCDIVGDGFARARLKEVTRSLGLSSHVRFLGRKSRSEVAQAMRECTVFVLPSRYEGLGCVYLEAMACEKPVIGCAKQGIDEIIEHGRNGWLISGEDVPELVQVLRTALTDTALCTQVGKAARQTVLGNFTWTHQARKLLDVYREVTRHWSALGLRDSTKEDHSSRLRYLNSPGAG